MNKIYVAEEKYFFPSESRLGGYVAVDNSTGDEWTEWFATEEEARAYLSADWGTGDDFRNTCAVSVFDSKRGIGPNAKECLIFLIPSRYNNIKRR